MSGHQQLVERIETRLKALSALYVDVDQHMQQQLQRRSEIDSQLALPEVYTDGDRVRQLNGERKELESMLGPLEVEWQRRAL